MANARQPGALEGLLWLAQRLSGLLLLAGLGLHLAVIHLAPGADSAFREVSVRLAQPGWRLFEAAFLIVATAHALGGLWTIACDYVASPAVRRLLLLLLVALSAEILAMGLYTLIGLSWAG